MIYLFIFFQLKAENKELKQKIGEHESALAKLQKVIIL